MFWLIDKVMFLLMASPVWLLMSIIAAVVFRRKRWLPAMIVAICVFTLATAGEVWLMVQFNREVGEVTNPARYQESIARIRPQLERADALDVFPKTIPTFASEVRMYFRPGFLQGGNMIELRYKLPRSELHLAVVRANKRRIPTTQPTDAPNATPPLRNDANKDFWDAPTDFRFVPINFVNHGQVDGGYSAGIAVSEARSEIVYWYMDYK